MIPNKLYIPTSTLNFNNIMASESISPAGFYYKRGFGYKRFDKVEPNNLDNRIILYDKFPIFNINDKELESYPLVIEIDTKTIDEDIIQEYKNGVFYSEETIYFNPFSTRFIFNDENEKRSTLSKVEQSLNTKMLAIYQNCIIKKTPNVESFEWKAIDLTDSKSDFSKISKDRRINKLKGFLYAYLLGANKSVSKNVVYAKKRTKSFSNELSALVNSISAKEADKILNCLDVFVDDINSISDKIKIELKDLPILQHCSRVEKVQENNFLPKLFNEYLAENWDSEEFVNSRLDFATAGGKLFKEELQDKWDNSPTKNYINDLRNNLASHTAFSLQSTDNLTLQSFGAFCQKGEEDIIKLEDYLISNGIGDFHIAFALWGIIFGFANTPKTLTNDLFLSNDLDYTSAIYKYIFKQVHGIELLGNLEKMFEEEKVVSISSKMNEQPIKKNTTVENQIITLLEQELSEFEEFTSRDAKTKREIITKLTETDIYSLSAWNSKKVDSIKWTTSKGQKALMKAIAKSKQNEGREKQPFQQQKFISFTISPEKEFYKDPNAFELIESVLPSDKKIKTQVKEEIDWIQKVHKDGGYPKKSGDWIKLDDHSNQAVIKHFENNAKNRIEPILLVKIVGALKKLYLIGE